MRHGAEWVGAAAGLGWGILASAGAWAQVSFQTVAAWPTGQSNNMVAILAEDGRTVIGTDAFSLGGGAWGQRAWRWNTASGHAAIPPLGAGARMWVQGVSGDGSVVVGLSDDGLGSQQSWRWSGGAAQELGNAGGAGPFRVSAISRDGRTIVGTAGTAGYRRVDDGPYVALTLAAGVRASVPVAVSGASNLITGVAIGDDEVLRIMRLHETGAQALIELPGLGRLNIINAVSSSGSAIVGATSDDFAFLTPFRWTQSGGFGALPAPSLTGWGIAGVSDDGETVYANWGAGPLVWTQSTGYRALRDVLVEGGANLSGVYLSDVMGVSGDGLRLLVRGGMTGGEAQLFLFSIPAPPGVAGVIFLGWAVARRRR